MVDLLQMNSVSDMKASSNAGHRGVPVHSVSEREVCAQLPLATRERPNAYNKRTQHCTLCKNHGIIERKNGHNCKLTNCMCALCQLTQISRMAMKHQQAWWRRQNRVITKDTKNVTNKQYCDKCRNHNKFFKKRGHKPDCKRTNCKCIHCVLTDKRRLIMKYQQRIRRANITVLEVSDEDDNTDENDSDGTSDDEGDPRAASIEGYESVLKCSQAEIFQVIDDAKKVMEKLPQPEELSMTIRKCKRSTALESSGTPETLSRSADRKPTNLAASSSDPPPFTLNQMVISSAVEHRTNFFNEPSSCNLHERIHSGTSFTPTKSANSSATAPSLDLFSTEPTTPGNLLFQREYCPESSFQSLHRFRKCSPLPYETNRKSQIRYSPYTSSKSSPYCDVRSPEVGVKTKTEVKTEPWWSPVSPCDLPSSPPSNRYSCQSMLSEDTHFYPSVLPSKLKKGENDVSRKQLFSNECVEKTTNSLLHTRLTADLEDNNSISSFHTRLNSNGRINMFRQDVGNSSRDLSSLSYFEGSSTFSHSGRFFSRTLCSSTEYGLPQAVDNNALQIFSKMLERPVSETLPTPRVLGCPITNVASLNDVSNGYYLTTGVGMYPAGSMKELMQPGVLSRPSTSLVNSIPQPYPVNSARLIATDYQPPPLLYQPQYMSLASNSHIGFPPAILSRTLNYNR